MVVMSFSSVSNAQWNYGIGTGMFGLNIDGDIGFNTTAGDINGEIDLDASDTSDLMESAIGLGGYATDGTWMIMYSYGALELEGSSTNNVPGIGSVTLRSNLEVTGAELTVGYPVYKSSAVKLLVDAGLRYTEHDYQFHATGAVTQTRDISNDWTDFLIGATAIVPIVQDWNWNTRANAGFGGSEGTYFFKTGVTWMFTQGWSTTLYGKYMAVEFEEGNRGNADWYLYDADEFGLGLSFAYNW